MADPINDLNRTLGSIASDVKHILRAQQVSIERTEKLEDRVRALEGFRWKLVGMVTAIPTGISLFTMYARGMFH